MIEVSDAAEPISILKAMPVDVVITDLRMSAVAHRSAAACHISHHETHEGLVLREESLLKTGPPVTDKSEDLRREAARCREAAERSTDPNFRDELIRFADKFLELANSVKADFAPVMEAVAAMMKEASELVVQQQQQVQPPKKEE